MIFPQDIISSLIFESLSQRGVATAKMIHTDVVSVLGENISLQSIYKNINFLIKSMILVKYGSYYSLSLIWLNKIKDITSKAEEKIRLGNHYHKLFLKLDEGQKKVIITKNQIDMIHKIDNIVIALLSYIPINTKIVYYGYHTLMRERKSMNEYIDLSQIQWESFMCGDTKWDKNTAKLRDSKNVKHYHVKKYLPFRFLCVMDNFIIEMNYDKDYKKYLDQSVLKASKDFDWLPIRSFLYNPVSKIKTKIWKNKKYANHLKKLIESIE